MLINGLLFARFHFLSLESPATDQHPLNIINTQIAPLLRDISVQRFRTERQFGQRAQNFMEVRQIEQHSRIKKVVLWQSKRRFARSQKNMDIPQAEKLENDLKLACLRSAMHFYKTWAIVGFKLMSFRSIQPGSMRLSNLHRSTPSRRMFAKSAMPAWGQFALWSGRNISQWVSQDAASRHSSSFVSQNAVAII